MAYLGAANAGIPLSMIVKVGAVGCQAHMGCACRVLRARPRSALAGLHTAHRLQPCKQGRCLPIQGWCIAESRDLTHARAAQNYGWEAYFAALGVSCGMALLLLAPMVNLKSYVQREEARAKAA